jgi:hypothetical protein
MKYEPLNKSLQEIRLAKLLPNRRGDPPSLELIHVIIDQSKSYNYSPVSYTWGVPSDKMVSDFGAVNDPYIILLNGCNFRITSNLYSFLKHVQVKDGDDDTFLWIDAICVDQNDIAEPNSQVQLMHLIYAGDSGTLHLAWSGSARQ